MGDFMRKKKKASSLPQKSTAHAILITDQHREAEISQTVGCICRPDPSRTPPATCHCHPGPTLPGPRVIHHAPSSPRPPRHAKIITPAFPKIPTPFFCSPQSRPVFSSLLFLCPVPSARHGSSYQPPPAIAGARGPWSRARTARTHGQEREYAPVLPAHAGGGAGLHRVARGLPPAGGSGLRRQRRRVPRSLHSHQPDGRCQVPGSRSGQQ
jgi:hypothetical protein